MRFTWIDYPEKYEDEIETWCDEPAVRFALDDNSVKVEHKWYLDSDKYTYNENYFCKIALDGGVPVALLMLAVFYDETEVHFTESIVYLDTLIISPALRNQGYGAKIIADILHNAEQIIGSGACVFVSQIHKDNGAAKRLSAKLGFELIFTEAEKNYDWFDWVYPASAAGRYLAFRSENLRL